MKRSILLFPAAAVVTAAMAFASIKAKKARNAKAKIQTPEPPKPAAKNLQQGSYEYVSGYKDAATVKVSLLYDADKFSFDILDSDFPVYTSDSHAAFLSGEDFAFQLEYSNYFSGEGFDELVSRETEKHPAAEKIGLAGLDCLKYTEGDNIVFTVPADSCSCLLVNVIKDKANDESLEELSRESALLEILNSLKIEIN